LDCMRLKLHKRLWKIVLLLLVILSWIAMISFFIYKNAIVAVYDPNQRFSNSLEFNILYTIFLASSLGFLGRIFGRIEKLNVITLLWRLFFIGMIAVGIMLVSIISNVFTRDLTLANYLAPIFFFINLLALVSFFLSAIFIFKRFVLYQRTQQKLNAWYIFIIIISVALLFPILQPYLSPPLSYFLPATAIIYTVVVIYLSTSVRWIAYLNFNQKLRSLGLFTLIIIVSITCFAVLQRFPMELGDAYENLAQNLFIYFIIIFPITYSGFSILVLFFNLPTSSIFELNSLKIASVQKINQAIQSNLDFTEISNSLLDASLMASNAKAGWLEMISEESGKPEIKIHKRISLKEIDELKQGYDLTGKVLKENQHFLVKNTRRHRAFRRNNNKLRSFLVSPITSNNHQYGAIYVASDLVNSFEDVTIHSVNSFAEQAGLALENAQLVRESIEMERYQEQLKIAKEVQNELLPRDLPLSDKLEFVALSETAYEVGGDYFDILPYQDKFRVAIGDVSGKGTTAAFYMAEIKGIFHALSLLDLPPSQFICYTNQALSQCMQKGFFMTLTYLQIDLSKQTVDLIRAGHCPSFYYSAESDQVTMLKAGTVGLGIVRDSSFNNYLHQPEKLSYQSGDMIILYTDGIVETRNEQKEEFGYTRLQKLIEDHIHESADQLVHTIVQKSREFGESEIEDDYTVLVIRFK